MSYEFLKCYTNAGKDWASKTEDLLARRVCWNFKVFGALIANQVREWSVETEEQFRDSFSGFYQFLGHIKSVLVPSVHGWMVNFTDE